MAYTIYSTTVDHKPHAILVFEAHITRKNIKEVARTCPIDSRVSSVGLGGDGETSGA